MATLFTKIIQGEIPASFVWKDELSVAFMSINPLRPGHTLVVPRDEVEAPPAQDLLELDVRDVVDEPIGDVKIDVESRVRKQLFHLDFSFIRFVDNRTDEVGPRRESVVNADPSAFVPFRPSLVLEKVVRKEVQLQVTLVDVERPVLRQDARLV